MIQINTNGNICEGCFHSNVCKYKADVKGMSDKLNSAVKVNADLSDIKDMPISVQLNCKYYSGLATNSGIASIDDSSVRLAPQIVLYTNSKVFSC